MEKNPLKSISGKKCLTKCNKRGVDLLHPITFNIEVDRYKTVCAIYPVHMKTKLGDTRSKYLDECRLNDNYNYDLPNESDTLLLQFNFDPEDFLLFVYGISTFDDAVYWLKENKNAQKKTKKRIHNSMWAAYGIDGIHSIESIEYYYKFVKETWFDSYVKKMNESAELKNLIPNSKPNEFLSNVFTFSVFSSTVKKYINDNKQKWNEIVYHYDKLKKFIFDILVDIIKKNTNNIINESNAL